MTEPSKEDAPSDTSKESSDASPVTEADASRESREAPDRRRGFSIADLNWLELDTLDQWRDRGVLMVLAALLFIPLLGAFGLWDPWETHYGEVARQITERNDWISTWWGSHWEDGAQTTEGDYFFSKPILLMWMMAFGLETFGFTEWGIRLGVAILAMFVLLAVYTMGAKVFRRRTGWLMVGVMATCPFFFFMARQAQTDMPYVGLMTIGLCFFMIAVFGRDRNRPADKMSYTLTFGIFGAMVLPQVWLMLVGLTKWRGDDLPLMEYLTDAQFLTTYLGDGHPMTRPGIVVTLALMLTGAMLLVLSLAQGGSGSERRRRIRRQYGVGAMVVVWLPFLCLAGLVLLTSEELALDMNALFVWGPTQAALYATCFAGALYMAVAFPVPERKRLYMLGFYVCCGLSTLAKGLLGFLLPGCVLFFYILLTREWRLLKRVDLVPGILMFAAICVPWYAGMLIRHTDRFWQRFFIHDHFKRFGSGVHQIDTGSIEHFIRWLGYGLYPWSAFIPASVGYLLSGRALEMDDDRGRATFMLILWATIAFTLFTISSTKFHHYIFPAVPPLAMLVALALDDALDRELPEPWPLYLLAAGGVVLIAWDLVNDPQLLKDIFTYKYEREWDDAWNPAFQWWIGVLAVPAVVGTLSFLFRDRVIRRWALGGVFVTSLGMAMFGMYNYMPTISSTWSQKGVWDAYYSHCDRLDPPEDVDERRAFCDKHDRWDICEYYDEKKRYCEQRVISYKLNWRGETYYTQNQVIPVRDDQDWRHFKKSYKGTFYGIMQRGRYHGGFKRDLPPRYRGKSCILYEKNIKFVLVKAPCTEEDRERAKELFGPDLKQQPTDEMVELED